jgi:hypothetical protein
MESRWRTIAMNAFDAIEFTPFNEECMIQSLRSDGSGLRVSFAFDGVRYRHGIALVLHGNTPQEQVIPWGQSVEGNDCDVWPPSPPLQNLCIETQAEQRVALLLGMAGRSHWSASFQSVPNGVIEVEIACRVGHEPVQLGSCYTWDTHSWHNPSTTKDEVLFQIDDYQIAVRGEQLNAHEKSQLRIPAPHPWNIKPIVWKYRLAIV